MEEKEIYFDNAATTRIYPETVKVMQHFFTQEFWNPSSMYRPAIQAEKELEKARETVAAGLNVPARDLYFTSGGTEGSNTVIRGVCEAQHNHDYNIITTQVEHPAVLEVFRYYEDRGIKTTYLPVDEFGRADLKALEEALNEKTALVSIMAVNNELGSINDLVKAGALIHEKSPKAVFHSDFVQAFMKLDDPRLDIKKAGLDAVNVSGHKIHGPKGIGALYIRNGVRILPLLLGGGQERGMRSGTENLALAAGLASAVEKRTGKTGEMQAHAQILKERLLKALSDDPDLWIGSADDASPYVISLGFRGIRGEVLLHILEDQGIYISTGSACSTHHKGGHVQKAAGTDREATEGTVRISTSEDNTPEEIDQLAGALKAGVKQLRRVTRFHSKDRSRK
ncbi:MAG: cysteine desulfurase family protein [Eubacteriaceae bacterium]|jgi:cysteine desulfurase